MNWKKIWRAVVAVISLASMLFTNACSTSWIQEAQQIVAALIPAAANIVALVAAVQGQSVSQQDLQTIQNAGTQAGADLQLLSALIQQYESADSGAKAGILSQIQAAITTTQANLSGILPALHIKDAATQAKISAVIGVVLAEVQSLAAVVPLVSGASPMLAAKDAARMGHSSAVSVRAPLSASEFVDSYNKAMTAKTGNAELDRAAGRMTIHLHGKLERVATVGMEK